MYNLNSWEYRKVLPIEEIWIWIQLISFGWFQENFPCSTSRTRHKYQWLTLQRQDIKYLRDRIIWFERVFTDLCRVAKLLQLSHQNIGLWYQAQQFQEIACGTLHQPWMKKSSWTKNAVDCLDDVADRAQTRGLVQLSSDRIFKGLFHSFKTLNSG